MNLDSIFGRREDFEERLIRICTEGTISKSEHSTKPVTDSICSLAFDTGVRKDESRTSEAAYKGVYLDSRNTKMDGLKSTDRANERKGGVRNGSCRRFTRNYRESFVV